MALGPDELLDASAALYAADHLVEVDITLDPHDWDRIRNEGRALTKVYSGCGRDYEYTWAKAKVTVDGATASDVAVRKKGFLGSLSQVKPSLKVDFNQLVKGQELAGVESLTLNNDKQDSSHTHQCMAYQLFRAAKLPAPRCNFAKVTVNGEAVGTYTNVESIKKDFLARHFEDDSGNLYEGTGADFDARMISRFELKTNEKEQDRSDLDRVVAALQVDDAALYRSLESVFDMDAFLTFWAMESITGHWDGYAGNQNNFFLYHDPKTDKFYFIPWGVDDAFYPGHLTLAAEDLPKSVYAWSVITHRLYANPESRAKLQQKIRSLLDEVWDEAALLSEVDRIGRLTSADEGALERQRAFIRTRRQVILAELDAGAPDWPYRPGLKGAGSECLPVFAIEGGFDTTWGDLNGALAPAPTNGFRITNAAEVKTTFTFDLHTSTINQSFVPVLASAGFAKNESPRVLPGAPSLWIVGVQSTGGSIAVAFVFEPSRFGGREQPLFGLETFGVVVRNPGSQILGYIGDGKVVFDELGTAPGSRVRGHFSGSFVPTVTEVLRQ